MKYRIYQNRQFTEAKEVPSYNQEKEFISIIEPAELDDWIELWNEVDGTLFYARAKVFEVVNRLDGVTTIWLDFIGDWLSEKGDRVHPSYMLWGDEF